MFVFLTPHAQLIAVIYRPPKCNTNFLTEFAEFLGDVTLKYDKLLVLGDFNVHVWCMNDHLAKEFTHLQNAFDFSIGVMLALTRVAIYLTESFCMDLVSLI